MLEIKAKNIYMVHNNSQVFMFKIPDNHILSRKLNCPVGEFIYIGLDPRIIVFLTRGLR